MGRSTIMYYQVESDVGGVHENMCSSLKEARVIAKELKKSLGGRTAVYITRYDRSGESNYYEPVETI